MFCNCKTILFQVTTDSNPTTVDYRVQFKLKRRENVLKDRINKNRQRYKHRYGSKVKSYESLDQFYKDIKNEKEIAELQDSGKTEDVKSLEQLVQLARGEEEEQKNKNFAEEGDTGEERNGVGGKESSDAKSGQTQSHQSNFQNKELLKGKVVANISTIINII